MTEWWTKHTLNILRAKQSSDKSLVKHILFNQSWLLVCYTTTFTGPPHSLWDKFKVRPCVLSSSDIRLISLHETVNILNKAYLRRLWNGSVLLTSCDCACSWCPIFEESCRRTHSGCIYRQGETLILVPSYRGHSAIHAKLVFDEALMSNIITTGSYLSDTCPISRLSLLYTGKISPPFYFHPWVWGRIQNWVNWILHKRLYNEIGERANFRLGESVSDLCRAKIRLDKFKAVYRI